MARRPIAPVAAPVPEVDASEPSPAATAETAIVDAAPPPRPHVWRIKDDVRDSRALVMTGVVGKRGMLGAMLAAGMSDADAKRVLKTFARVKSLDRARPGDAFSAERRDDGDSGSKLYAFEYETGPFDVWQAKADAEAGELALSKLELVPDEVRVAKGFVVASDLRSSLKEAGLRDELLSMLDDALDGRAELTDVHAGSQMKILATEDWLDGEFVRTRALDAVSWTAPGRPELRVYWFAKGWTEPAKGAGGKDSGKHGSSGGYYDGKGHQPYHGAWRSPVPLARISSRFNPNRMHPVLHVVMPHNGVDFAAPPGTPVYAAAAGVVKSAGDGGPCGNMVQIDHPNGLTSAYCHLQRFAPGLRAGEQVGTRQLVGYVGQTGRATGPHLHFAVKRGEAFLDPLALKLDSVRVLPNKDRDAFDALRMRDDEALEQIGQIEATSEAEEGDGGAEDGGALEFYDEP